MVVVRFNINISIENNIYGIECNKCQELAIIYCENDELYLCEDCDEQVHSDIQDEFLLKLMEKHKRINLTDKKKDFGKCVDHPERSIELYCLSCDKSLCMNCKI